MRSVVIANGTKNTLIRFNLYAALVALFSIVSDGWSGKPSPLAHQVLLLPATILASLLLWEVLKERAAQEPGVASGPNLLRSWKAWLIFFEIWSVLLIFAEGRHFRQFGYSLQPISCLLGGAFLTICIAVVLRARRDVVLLLALVLAYGTGLCFAMHSFPLNYLRSDMVPVIQWADLRLVHHLNPYGTMHVGGRTYDFPYLPGMLVGFLPAVALRIDMRWMTISYVVGSALVIFWCGSVKWRREITALLGLFLLCPFLQYRHDLYLAPHWFALAAAVALMQKRRFFWSAVVWGVSCGVYQLSWVIVPFAILNAYRRKGLFEALKSCAAALAGVAILCGPFLAAASKRIASNTVGQWSHLPHALADPINFSYWLTYLVRPDQLQWIQGAVLVTMFGYCAVKGKCDSLTDTLRWMCFALALFIPLNVLVDGYFYLTLLLLLLLFICAANDWWPQHVPQGASASL